MSENGKAVLFVCSGFVVSFIIIIFILFGINYGYREYKVWSMGMEGKAELSKADWDRQIAVREAKAKMESAKMLAKAEVERAKGVAEANKIIGNSLKGNEDYLRYLWIDHLQNEKNQVIYVPTEANLPILEASRMSK